MRTVKEFIIWTLTSKCLSGCNWIVGADDFWKVEQAL